MNVSVVARQGNIFLVAYNGLDGRKRYSIKWCSEKKAILELDSSEKGSQPLNDNVDTTGSHNNFSAFQKKRINRLTASRIDDNSVVNSIKKQFQDEDFQSFKEFLKGSADKGIWGIEIEEFLQREAKSKKKNNTLGNVNELCQLCWYKSLNYWSQKETLSVVQCLEQILNLEERLKIDGFTNNSHEVTTKNSHLIEPIVKLKENIQQQLEATSPVDRVLIALYVNYDLYSRIDPFSEGTRSATCLAYIDALVAKANSEQYLSVATPGELCELLKMVIACSKSLKGTFEPFSSGHYKWQQLNICISPLVAAIRDKVNGNIFKSSVAQIELVALNQRMAELESGTEDKGIKKKIRQIAKGLDSLYRNSMNKRVSLLLAGKQYLQAKDDEMKNEEVV